MNLRCAYIVQQSKTQTTKHKQMRYVLQVQYCCNISAGKDPDEVDDAPCTQRCCCRDNKVRRGRYHHRWLWWTRQKYFQPCGIEHFGPIAPVCRLVTL